MNFGQNGNRSVSAKQPINRQCVFIDRNKLLQSLNFQSKFKRAHQHMRNRCRSPILVSVCRETYIRFHLSEFTVLVPLYFFTSQLSTAFRTNQTNTTLSFWWNNRAPHFQEVNWGKLKVAKFETRPAVRGLDPTIVVTWSSPYHNIINNNNTWLPTSFPNNNFVSFPVA